MGDLDTGFRLMVASCNTDMCSFSNGCGCAEKIASALATARREGFRAGEESMREHVAKRVARAFEVGPAIAAAIRSMPIPSDDGGA